MEQTLLAIKTAGLQRGRIGSIIKRFEDKGLTMVAAKMAENEKHPVYKDIQTFMSDSPLLVTVWKGKDACVTGRHLVGKSNPPTAGTICGDFGDICHVSADAESAQREMSQFWFLVGFSKLDLRVANKNTGEVCWSRMLNAALFAYAFGENFTEIKIHAAKCPTWEDFCTKPEGFIQPTIPVFTAAFFQYFKELVRNNWCDPRSPDANRYGGMEVFRVVVGDAATREHQYRDEKTDVEGNPNSTLYVRECVDVTKKVPHMVAPGAELRDSCRGLTYYTKVDTIPRAFLAVAGTSYSMSLRTTQGDSAIPCLDVFIIAVLKTIGIWTGNLSGHKKSTLYETLEDVFAAFHPATYGADVVELRCMAKNFPMDWLLRLKCNQDIWRQPFWNGDYELATSLGFGDPEWLDEFAAELRKRLDAIKVDVTGLSEDVVERLAHYTDEGYNFMHTVEEVKPVVDTIHEEFGIALFEKYALERAFSAVLNEFLSRD